MPVAIALLRGINVGGKNKLPMAQLRALGESLGWTEVATLIQSGNVVFRCPDRALPGAANKLEAAIEKAAGFRPSVITRTAAQLRAALAACPYTGNPSHILIMLLESTPDAAAKKAVASLKPDPERLTLIGDEVHLQYPDGIGASKFPFTQVERAVKVPGTCRNLNTLSKLLAMADAIER